MGIFSNILGKIFGHKPKAAPAPAPTPQAQPGPTPQEQAHAQAPAPVDIEAVLEDMAANNPQKLNWRTSIVDLMKLVGMESSLQERKDLADELGYTGDKSDSAAMNIWLHKAVLKKLSENGGKVPASLMD
ncbi:DUF3597 domain-containing protein [Caulobacter sp. NIBR1757]|uniref:DUF3597 domain-containing protein n=1 Tax=Caulobacter sp. NIBR1757 TaxID=3016000 RepID=UPI0022F10DA7|nr:DUF3597 domain-containing protein [Caulobacter sp. NIBR1757]WGM38113.1 hypothetical protein AMEJIAPC_01014 [Caulobacter sp. NIBR1757]